MSKPIINMIQDMRDMPNLYAIYKLMFVLKGSNKKADKRPKHVQVYDSHGTVWFICSSSEFLDGCTLHFIINKFVFLIKGKKSKTFTMYVAN